jgi:preprotein translocase subunit SecG
MAGYFIVAVLILIVCILLILLVLVQNSKGGGLTSTFSSSNQVLGVKKTADFLEKSTWTMAIALFGLTLATVFVIPRTKSEVNPNSSTIEYLKKNPKVKPMNFKENPQNPSPVQPAQPAQQGGALPGTK